MSDAAASKRRPPRASPRRRSEGPNEARGQSHVVGIVLLFGIVLVGAGAVVMIGTTALSDQRANTEFDAARLSMEQAGSSIDEVATGRSGSATLPFDDVSGEHLSVEPGEGTLSVMVTAPNGTTLSDESVALGAVKYERNGRSVAYQGGGVFAAQSGGSVVVSPPSIDYAGGSESTLTFPVVSVEGTISGDGIRAQRVQSTSLLDGVTMPIDPTYTVTLTIQSSYYQGWATAFNDSVGSKTVTVDSSTQTVRLVLNEVQPTPTNDEVVGPGLQSEGRGGYLTNDAVVDSYDSSVGAYGGTNVNDRADVRLHEAGEVSSDATVRGDLHIGQMVGNKLFSKNVHVTGETVIGDSPGGPITFQGGSGGPGQVFAGPFSTKDDLDVARHATFHGDVVVGGNVENFRSDTDTASMYVHGDATLADDTRIEGDLIVGGDLEIAWGTVEVTGDVIYAGTMTGSGTLNAGGSVQQDPSTANARLSANPPKDPVVPDYAPVGDLITEKGQSIQQSNQNLPSPGVDAATNRTQCDGPPTSCSIGAGQYYFERIEPETGDTLTFNTNTGDVVGYVEQGVTIHDGVDIDVTGDNQVILYVNTGGGTDSAFEMTGSSHGSNVTIPSDDASQFWVYARPNASVGINSYASFTGVVYGPGGNGHDGVDVRVTNYGVVTGAVVGNLTQLSEHAEMHLDENLGAPPTGGTTYTSTEPTVRFVRATAHEVTVE